MTALFHNMHHAHHSNDLSYLLHLTLRHAMSIQQTYKQGMQLSEKGSNSLLGFGGKSSEQLIGI